MTSRWARVAVSHPAFCGLSRSALVRLVAELQGPWVARVEGERRARRGRGRLRAAGAGHPRELVFTDRVLVTLVVLRFQLPHLVVAVMFGVHRSTVTRAIHQVRPLLASRGFAAGDGPRLRTLADVFAYAQAEGVSLRVDGSEIQVRRPPAGRPGRRAFVSGKKKQNTITFTLITGPTGRTLWAGNIRPGRVHDQTAIKTEGIDELLRLYPTVKLEVDAGYRGLARDHPDQVTCPPHKPGITATEEEVTDWRAARKTQSSSRICVEHGIGELKAWRPLQRWIGPRHHLAETIRAIASLTSDRTRTA